MEKKYVNEAASQLVKSWSEINQAAVESAVVIEERNMQFLQSLFLDWIEALKDQSQNSGALLQELEQQAQKQLEGFQQLTRESVDSSFAFFRAPLSSYPPSLRLQEKLQICLLSLASRYPDHLVDINEEMLGPQSLGAEGWKASDLIELFQSSAPQLLHALARLEVNTERRGIYLLDHSEETPAFWIHCGEKGEKMPPYRGNMAARKEEQMQRPDEASGAHHPASAG